MAEASLVFISGGVRSGKSTFAEQLANTHAKRRHGKLHYIACGQHTDGEMSARIKRHQETREANSIPWRTWEQPVNLLGIADQFTKQDIVLIDCITTLLSNELFADDDYKMSYPKDRQQAILQGVKRIQKNSFLTIVVSNEVFHEPVGTEPLTIIYTKMLGQLHQKLVATATHAFVVEAGIPIVMKGEIFE